MHAIFGLWPAGIIRSDPESLESGPCSRFLPYAFARMGLLTQIWHRFSIEDAFARLVVIAHLDRGASVFTLPKDFKGTAEELTGFSPGDSGTHLVDLDDGFSITSYDGYGAS
ncbi:MAG: hypothetical protein JOZ11_12000, partial [Alphaproteobacteria bacterium]|nr:hypothetical protein [Alphaproteobacteria bacterium]